MYVYFIQPDGRHGWLDAKCDDVSLFKQLQAFVGGGCIESLPQLSVHKHALVGYVNDEGLVVGLQCNVLAQYLVSKIAGIDVNDVRIHGPLVLCQTMDESGEHSSLSRDRMAHFDRIFERVDIIPNDDRYDIRERERNFIRLRGNLKHFRQRYMTITPFSIGDCRVSGNRNVVLYGDNTLGVSVCETNNVLVDGGVTLTRVERGVYELLTTTVDDGVHTFSLYARLDSKGNLQSMGVHNAFALGPRAFRDQAVVDDLLEELCARMDAIGLRNFWHVS